MIAGRAVEGALTYREIGVLLGMTERGALDWVKANDLPVTGACPARVAAALVHATASAQGRPLVGQAERPAPRHDFGDTLATPEVGDGPSAPIEAAYRVEGEANAGAALVPHTWPMAESRGLVERLIELTRRTEDLAVAVGTLRGQRFMHEAALREKDTKIWLLEANIHDLNDDIKEDYKRYSGAKQAAKTRQDEQERELQELRDKLHRAEEKRQDEQERELQELRVVGQFESRLST